LTDGMNIGGETITFTDDAYFMIRRTGAGTNQNPDFHVFDNIVITAEVVPEPSSALLHGLGSLALISRRKRA